VEGRRLRAELYHQWERAMTAWWDQALASPAVLGAMGRGVAVQTGARTQFEHAVDSQLERLHLPTRRDIVRMTRIATLLEEKLLSQEDLLLQLREELVAARREAAEAREEAAAARVELQAGLAALVSGTPSASPRKARS
jgi:hypothetical protein